MVSVGSLNPLPTNRVTRTRLVLSEFPRIRRRFTRARDHSTQPAASITERDFTRRCWDGKLELRPEVGEPVMRIKEAAADRDGLMPPHTQDIEGDRGTPDDQMDVIFEHVESGILPTERR